MGSSNFKKLMEKRKENEKTPEEILEGMETNGLFDDILIKTDKKTELPVEKTPEEIKVKKEENGETTPKKEEKTVITKQPENRQVKQKTSEEQNTQIAQDTQMEENVQIAPIVQTVQKDKDTQTVQKDENVQNTQTDKNVQMTQTDEDIQKMSNNIIPEETSIGIQDIRKTNTEIEINEKATEAWGCRLSETDIDDLEYTAYRFGYTITEALNRILYSEKKYEEDHPEIFTEEYVRNNLRKRRKNRGNKQRKSFLFIPEMRNFLDEGSRRNGMTKTTFIEFLIDKYCR